MTKAELIDAVKDQAADGLTKKDVAGLVDVVFGTLRDAISSDGRFSYPDFGVFTVKERAAREGRNPRTGEKIQIAASKTVGFKPSPAFKNVL